MIYKIISETDATTKLNAYAIDNSNVSISIEDESEYENFLSLAISINDLERMCKLLKEDCENKNNE